MCGASEHSNVIRVNIPHDPAHRVDDKKKIFFTRKANFFQEPFVWKQFRFDAL